jgi:hypothetical protein
MDDADGIAFLDSKLLGLTRSIHRKPRVFGDQLFRRERASFRGGNSSGDTPIFPGADHSLGKAPGAVHFGSGYSGGAQAYAPPGQYIIFRPS